VGNEKYCAKILTVDASFPSYLAVHDLHTAAAQFTTDCVSFKSHLSVTSNAGAALLTETT